MTEIQQEILPKCYYGKSRSAMAVNNGDGGYGYQTGGGPQVSSGGLLYTDSIIVILYQFSAYYLM